MSVISTLCPRERLPIWKMFLIGTEEDIRNNETLRASESDSSTNFNSLRVSIFSISSRSDCSFKVFLVSNLPFLVWNVAFPCVHFLVAEISLLQVTTQWLLENICMLVDYICRNSSKTWLKRIIYVEVSSSELNWSVLIVLKVMSDGMSNASCHCVLKCNNKTSKYQLA